MPRRRKADPVNESRLLARSSELGRNAVVFDDNDVLQLLREAVEREGNQVAFARRHDIDRAFLNQVLRGRRQISDAVLKTLGLRKLYVAD
jgi:hypothetical protein